MLSSFRTYIFIQSKKKKAPIRSVGLCSLINSSAGDSLSDHAVAKLTTSSWSSTDQPNVSFDLTYRKNLLHEELVKLDCFDNVSDVVNFESVAQQTMLDPTMTTGTGISGVEEGESMNININGIQRYGKSSIKTCQTYYYPKNMNSMYSYDEVRWKIAAARTARQIEFLYQRHKAHQTQWIRNHDQTNAVPVVKGENGRATSVSNPFPFIILLDNVRSAENVGSIFRTADATKCQEVITIGITANPSNGNGITKIQKSALGAELVVPTRHFHNATTAVQYIQSTHCQYQIFIVETTSESIPYTDIQYVDNDSISSENINLNHGIVLIFGNEVTGVDVSFYKTQFNKNEERSSEIATPQQHHLHQKIKIIEIPMYGIKNSLNVAVCVSIILYEMIRQWNLHAKQ
jgi:23S rRNA (guanosine2251-2'-O)-methyltransferase